jgi:hypothetical protein
MERIDLALQRRIPFRQRLGHLEHFGQSGLTFSQSLTATDYGVAQSGDYGEGFFIGEGLHIGLVWIEGVGQGKQARLREDLLVQFGEQHREEGKSKDSHRQDSGFSSV